MKNIHVFSTDKPSSYVINYMEQNMQWQNIYITEGEIKEGDWILWEGKVVKAINTLYWDAKKIILTTDTDLISDGVQAIPDEFLQWFINNPSCEEIEIIHGLFNLMERQVDPMNLGQNHSQCVWKYKIIIPKEEPKQEMPIVNGSYGCTIQTKRRETLEEAAKSYAKIPLHRDIDSEERYFNSNVREYDAFIDGAKWQQDKNEAIEFAKWLGKNSQQREYYPMVTMSMEELFEQFKKK